MHCSLRFWACLPPLLGSLVFFSLHCGSALGKAPSTARADEVELFTAMKNGEVEVKVFLKDASGGTAVIKNNSARPLAIKLPDAFGAAPIAAQLFGPGGGAANGLNLGAGPNAGNGAGGGNQAVGGVFNGGGGANNNGRNGGLGGPGGVGFFNIEAGKERKIKLVSVCLEYGKDEPNSRLAYELRPIDSVTDKPEVAELVRTLGQSDVEQRSIQAAAWHLASGLEWKQLAQMPKIRHLNGLTERYFSAEQLERAREYAASATKLAGSQEKPRNTLAQSPGGSHPR